VKTVFLFLRQGISNRNLLRTDFLKALKEHPDVRTVIISPIGDDREFRNEFEASNVCVEKWPRTRVGFVEKRLKNLKDYIWVSRGLTDAIRVRRLAQRGKWGLAWRDAVGSATRRAGITEIVINEWELRVYSSDTSVAQLYDRYRPDLVVFTRLFGTNVHVIKEAKKRGIPVLCLVESWDNLICKGPLSIVPDRMAVWNDGMRTEAAKYHGFPAEKVDVVGVPQFDLYHDGAVLFIERDRFFSEHGLNPARKLITYAASTEGFISDELDIIESVYSIVRKNDTEIPCQLLVRLHPITSPDLRAEYVRRFTGRPNLVLQSPGRGSALHDRWDPSHADMLTLGATIYHSAVVIGVASTFSIDAAALDKPVICVGFGNGRGARSKWFHGVFDRSHYRRLVDTGGVRVVYSERELVDALRGYLGHPEIDSSGRARLREELCYRLDGQSARRAAAVVSRELGLEQAAAPGISGSGEQTGVTVR
jgi:hypothetical protein